jgi:hypothetical protein
MEYPKNETHHSFQTTPLFHCCGGLPIENDLYDKVEFCGLLLPSKRVGILTRQRSSVPTHDNFSSSEAVLRMSS